MLPGEIGQEIHYNSINIAENIRTIVMTGTYMYYTGDGWPGHPTDILTGETIIVD